MSENPIGGGNMRSKGAPQAGGKKPRFGFNIYWLYGLLAVFFIGLQFMNMSGGGPKEITGWSELKKMLDSSDVEKIIVVNKETAEIFIKKDKLNKPRFKDFKDKKSWGSSDSGPQFTFGIGSDVSFENNLKQAQSDSAGRIKPTAVLPIYENRTNWGSEIFSWLIPIALFVIIWIFIMRRMSGGQGGGGGQIFSFGKSRAKLFDKDTKVSVNFTDVAGLEEAKVEIMEIVEFLKNPKKYTDLGGKIPKGALLVGPPGTGKTLLAKAVAGEAQVPFFSISGSEFVEMFVGVGASRVRDLFKQAKEKAPCIVFIDEIDAIGRARGKNPMQGSNDERESTLNQLLTEMDGFASNAGVIILAATNRADILDRALLRAGRFDRQIQVELPDLEERKAIFKVHLRPIKISEEVNVEFLARQTPGFSGADIANVCNESALVAARKNKSSVDKDDFLTAVDRIIGGLEKRSKIISRKEKETIAFHESGHATASWMLQYASPLFKVTIVPRGKALGAAWYLPEERQITTSEQMLDEICATLGGRAAEEVICKTVSTGALNDLERATKQAMAMVTIYGLNKKIGNISYYDSTGQSEYALSKPYSEKTAQIIDEEISAIVEEQYARAKKILSDNEENLRKLAELLLLKEVIFKEDLEDVFGKRMYDDEKESDMNAKENIVSPEQPAAEPQTPEVKETE